MEQLHIECVAFNLNNKILSQNPFATPTNLYSHRTGSKKEQTNKQMNCYQLYRVVFAVEYFVQSKTGIVISQIQNFPNRVGVYIDK